MSVNNNFEIEEIYNTETDICTNYIENIISFIIPRNQIKSISSEEYQDISKYGIYFLVKTKLQNLFIGITDNLLKIIGEHSKDLGENFD